MNFVKATHKWLSLVIGLQLALWLASGLAFNLLDTSRVSGRHLADPQPAPVSLMAAKALLSHEAIADRYAPNTITSLELVHRLGRPLYAITTERGIELRDARTGLPFAIDSVRALEIARRDYAGDDRLLGTPVRMERTNLETRNHRPPIWRIDAADEFASTLYVSATDGRVLERRNDTWRLFDIFWMLHIMDYSERQDFNNPFVIAFGFGALLLSVSGCLLLFASFSRGDFNLLASLPLSVSKALKLHQNKVSIDLLDGSSTPINQLALASGSNLFDGLSANGIRLPSNCGGGGSCGLCRIRVEPQAPATHSEKTLLDPAELARGVRLACQQRASTPTAVWLADPVLQADTLPAEVTRSRFLTPLIKEIHLQPSAGQRFQFNAGSFVQVEIPPHRLRQADLLVDREYRNDRDWTRWRQAPGAQHTEVLRRSYSMANSPGEGAAAIVLNVRIQPPADNAHPAGAGSSYLFSLRVGDRVDLSGPFGGFHARDSEREMVLIGGGAGLAPLRSIIVDQLRNRNTERKMHLLYGARNLREVFYRELFDQLALEHHNFTWQLGLSAPRREDRWHGPCGNIGDIAASQYLRGHTDLANCEFYLCGPAAMLKACREMLDQLGIPGENILFEDFGF
ncbi:Na(+)-translocating NADH-quinone reductase subunit F [Microbulbifer aestuariivivens]|uniref:Na(+)-translocating NADH-quinone reductase subunit F n=1 Tax=Microbulbifer aestuariivivens TaxID=1908308 RepID=A0ABP9WQG7_9GAMM